MISSPKLLRWFTSLGVAPAAYFIRPPGAWPSPCGLPHSDVRGSKGMCPSPRPFAACRVLHRLTAPQASAMNLCLPGHILPPAPLRRIQGYVSHFHAYFILHHGTASRRAMLLCFPSLLPFQRTLPARRGRKNAFRILGRDRVELSTPALSERCSNQLSYHPSTKPELPKEKTAYMNLTACSTLCFLFPFP